MKQFNKVLTMKFEVAVQSYGFKFKISKDSWFSLFNSPYIAHRLESAVDVYCKEKEAFMPFDEGKVLEIRWFEVSKIRRDALDKEPLILIKLSEETVAKVLHVNPTVKVGEKIKLGDPIGKKIISGYFLPWTSPHAHFELRSIHDPYRAGGAYKLRINPKFKCTVKLQKNKMEFKVREVSEKFMWVEPKGENSGFFGSLPVLVGSRVHFLDGGIPYHGYGVVVGGRGETIKDLNGKVIGKKIGRVYAGTVFKTVRKPWVNGSPVLGVESFLNNNMLKIVGVEKKLSEGDLIKLEFR
ncbi:hypothetical protein DRO26_01145 [Candidatus Bathyarchaeota archaeon]|nr:MAG: hypothetical protein DRO26_01145 [Candidatus Bathyarchaeota archaeon]